MIKKYDVFISFKNSDAMGNKTKDSALAEKCYHYLTNKGLNVFFSDIELEFIGKAQYSNVIDDALDSSQFLIAVGCSHEHLNSRWVRYEWESFLNDIRSNIKPEGEVFILFQDMRVNDLPRALRQQQAFNADTDVSYEKLYNFISSALGKEKPEPMPENPENTVQTPMLEKTTQTPSEMPTNKRRRAIVFSACAVIFALVILLAFQIGRGNRGNQEAEPTIAAMEPTTSPVQSASEETTYLSLPEANDTVSFTLSPVLSLSDEDFAESLAIITRRVQSFATTYSISDHNGVISITIHESDLSTNPRVIEEAISMIAGVGMLSIWGGIGEDTFALYESEIQSAEVISGTLQFEMPDRTGWQMELMRDSDINEMYYIRVFVNESDGGVEKIRNAENARNSRAMLNVTINDTFVFAGLESSDVGLFQPFRGVHNEFYIVMYDFTNPSINNLLAAIINQPQLPARFFYEIEGEIIWETPDDSTRGLLQQDEITGSSVTLVYGFSDLVFYEDITEEDFANAVSVLRNRMDAIGNPYAIGFSGLGGRNIAIKTAPTRLGSDFIDLIGRAGEIRIETTTGIGFAPRDISAFVVNQSANNYVIEILLNEDIFNLEEIIDGILNETIYLSINGVRISSTVITNPNHGRIISFSEFSFVSHSDMSTRNRFILDFLNEIINGEQISYTTSWGHSTTNLEFLDIIWEEYRDVALHYRWGVNSDSPESARVRQVITSQFEDVTFRRIAGGGTLHFVFDLEVSDELPQQFVDLVIEIFETADLENTSYGAIFFFNENHAENADRFRLIFRRVRHSFFFETEHAGELSYTSFIAGPTFQGFAEEMESLFDSLEFFTSRPRN
ncbi:MAG: toll/interleukin-1 receptor domain-containing protein [Defluviitaleaceae bacterium]|nr:toll/interleukin-1 receptor domain-containing protein [Defluviitaleaceae bacterium]